MYLIHIMDNAPMKEALQNLSWFYVLLGVMAHAKSNDNTCSNSRKMIILG